MAEKKVRNKKKENLAEWVKLTTLGKGSYGTVYLAAIIAPQKWNRKVAAVKSSTTFSFSSLMKERTIMELFTDCEEIVQLYFAQYTEENRFPTYNLVMEFAPYGSLGDLIRKRPLMESEAKTYTRMILKGLFHIHQREIVHCDLKPDNILLFPSSEKGVKYQLKIADFGLSKNGEETIDADCKKICKFRGTPFYLSPESVIGQIETPLDIWSLGCIVIEMISGFGAWKNLETQEELALMLFFKDTPMIPHGLMSLNCQDFVSKCFIRDPSQRWTAKMLLNHPFFLLHLICLEVIKTIFLPPV